MTETPAATAATATLPPQTEKAANERSRIFGGDKHIWGIYIALCLISIVELYSASSREVAASSIGVYGPILRHGAQLLGGFLIVVAVQRLHYGKFAYAIPFFALGSVFMMIYVLAFGESINNASRSFNFIISIQPSEFLKISVVALIALVLSMTQNEDNTMRNRGMWITVGIVTLFAGLLIKDGLTNTAILMAISLAMMLIGGIKIKKFVMVVAVYALVGGAGYAISKEYDLGGRTTTRLNRVEAFSDSTPPCERPITPENQQEMYSYMAQANGGIIGVFPGNSRETSRLPLAFSDFIYSIVIEDLGLIGGLVVLVLFLWLLARASGIAARCHNCFAMLLVIGMAVFIVTQALTHMAITTGVVPVSGQPLPLISKGGTSILITSLAFGVMLSVSRFGSSPGRKKASKEDLENIPETVRSANPSQLSTE